MRPSKLRREIQNLLDLLLIHDVVIYANPVVKKIERGGLTRVSWSAPRKATLGELFRGEFATLDDYHSWLKSEAYSAVLYDGAILQMSYDFEGDQLTGHRLVYYPCPFDVDEDLLRSEPMSDVIDLYRENESSTVRLRSPLRFDCDIENQSEDHPGSHLTFLSSDCRLALVAPISPGHFVRFLFKHFYPTLWSSLEFIRDWPQRLGERTITAEQKGSLHVSCDR